MTQEYIAQPVILYYELSSYILMYNGEQCVAGFEDIFDTLVHKNCNAPNWYSIDYKCDS